MSALGARRVGQLVVETVESMERDSHRMVRFLTLDVGSSRIAFGFGDRLTMKVAFPPIDGRHVFAFGTRRHSVGGEWRRF